MLNEENVVFVENEFIKLGANMSLGGSITYLAEHGGKNIINSCDWGRQVQLSFYAHPVPYRPEGVEMGQNWTHTGWNPIQSGDCFGNRAKVIEYKVSENEIYVKCLPMQWALNNYPGECTFELWYRLDGKTVNATARLNNNRTDKSLYPACGQELPAVYTNGEYYRIVSYVGEEPFTNGEVTEIVSKNTERNWPSDYMIYPENWVALLDDNDYGLGVYNPFTCCAVGGFYGEMGFGGDKDPQTGTVSPTTFEILDHDIVYTFDYSLIVGDLSSIRKTAIELNKTATRRKYSFEKDRAHFYYRNITDKGFGNQDCLDFDFAPEGCVCAPCFFVKAGECREVILDADIFSEAGEVNGNVGFRLYRETTVPSKNIKYGSLPVKLDGKGGRKIHRIDISEMKDCFVEFWIEFGCHGSAKIYSIEFR
jgi:hypothetical protein